MTTAARWTGRLRSRLSHRRGVLFFSAWLFAAGTASAADDRPPDVRGSRVELAAVSSLELYDGPPQWSFAKRGVFTPGRQHLDSPPVATTVVRRIPDLWDLWLAEDEPFHDLNVTYELISEDGHADRLSHPASGGEIPVRLRSDPPEIVEHAADGATRVRGGVTLDLDLASARFAGAYRGTLTVTVSRP